MARLHVEHPGPLTLIQDAGRTGVAHLGVSPSGAFDRAAHARANALVGNDPGAAALEVLLGGLRLRAEGTVLVAVTGARLAIDVDGLPLAPERVIAVPHGSLLTLAPGHAEAAASPRGLRAYLAVAGGLDVPPVLGSRSRDTLGQLGPAPLTAGDVLPIGRDHAASRGESKRPGGAAPSGALPSGAMPTGAMPSSATPLGAVSSGTEGLPTAGTVLEVLPGPRPEEFDPDALARLTRGAYRVTDRADRVAVRLEGEAMATAAVDSRGSEGLVAGAIQIPPSGQPVVFGPDHPLTGGYPVLAVLTDAALGTLAQVTPGERVRFAVVSL
ncbi:biotin-dependent carboxyltransferase family protein [Serinibacter salmoneus]|uniref:Biotin-dependent carboxylase-like uncharacterized protein n=1 Tax=Serinibacter salmoneus TaxID=556530 RepID=A0A2A9D0P7_9MICO|nr:biotin-dependent carboxyltransferase family protein [Serinibacter salmoneus]PFG20234.1 biotin-dependent carboxylase-like uncharacterized protein [Serinibacter salmoneus]